MPDDTTISIPYCGPAPLPSDLSGMWNLDPVLIGVLAVGAYLSRGCGWRLAGVAVLAVAFISPLCALASALFSARVLHHILIVAIAAPLLAVGMRWRPGTAAMAYVAHMAAIWLWHMPQPYAFALASDPGYWVMELTLLGSAVWLWAGMLAPGRAGQAMLLSLGTLLQMGMLGALLTFAGHPLFGAHLLTTAPWGLTPLEDQQLAGLMMWAPAALPYLGFALHRLMTGFLSGKPA